MSTMPRVTYVFGAGASAQALPVVGKIKENLSQLYEQVDKRLGGLAAERSPGRPYPEEYVIPPKGSYAAPLFVALDQLKTIAASHPSLDTYAKKLYLRTGSEGDPEITRLKAALACYILLLQTLQSPGSAIRPLFCFSA
jgi:hypothetical protein